MTDEVDAEVTIRPRRINGRAVIRQQRIEQILEVAAQLFVQEGYAQFSSRRVAQEVGISLGNIQHFCGNTENLLMQMITAKLKPFVERLNALNHDKNRSPTERLEAAIETDFNATWDPWTRSFCFQLGALASDDPNIGELLNSLYQEYLTEMTALVLEINSSLGKDQALVLATLIASQIEGQFFYSNQATITTFHRRQMLVIMKKTWLMAVQQPEL